MRSIPHLGPYTFFELWAPCYTIIDCNIFLFQIPNKNRIPSTWIPNTGHSVLVFQTRDTIYMYSNDRINCMCSMDTLDAIYMYMYFKHRVQYNAHVFQMVDTIYRYSNQRVQCTCIPITWHSVQVFQTQDAANMNSKPKIECTPNMKYTMSLKGKSNAGWISLVWISDQLTVSVWIVWRIFSASARSCWLFGSIFKAAS